MKEKEVSILPETIMNLLAQKDAEIDRLRKALEEVNYTVCNIYNRTEVAMEEYEDNSHESAVIDVYNYSKIGMDTINQALEPAKGEDTQ